MYIKTSIISSLTYHLKTHPIKIINNSNLKKAINSLSLEITENLILVT